MPENTELSELKRRLHDAHESSSRLRDTITRLEAEKVLLAKLAHQLEKVLLAKLAQELEETEQHNAKITDGGHNTL